MDKLFKNTAYRILETFIEQPTRDFSARGIARELSINHATVLTYLKRLLKLGLIKKKTETLYPTYFANTENPSYMLHKKNHVLDQIRRSGLVEHLKSTTLASAIVLFGSCAKGSYASESDIDIFVEAKASGLDLKYYEKKLKRKINILFQPAISQLSAPLRNNVLNGVVLEGFIRIG